MDIFGFLRPRPTLTEKELSAGLRWFTWEGTVSMGFFSITTSGILVAYALAIGASNLQIGVMAAIPFLMQTLQIPAIWLVEKYRRRKVIVLLSWFPAQLLWLPIALIPFFMDVPSGAAISLLLVLLAFRGMLAAVCNAAWNGWQRDLVPVSIMGRFFSRRMAYATASAVVFSLGAASFVDLYSAHASAGQEVFGYTWAIVFGAVFLGLASPVFMALMPEPLMQPLTGVQPTMIQRLLAPVRDINFRRLLQFLFYWSFASNLAIPFFSVHMLQRLGLPVILVIGFSVLSQAFNIMFLRVWGPYADRFGNKSVLSVGVSLYLLVILGWIFTTMPENYFLTIPLLVLLHIFAGIASAAVSFTVGNIGLKLAPREEATSYLATAALATNLGAGFGPLLGGFLADIFATRQANFIFNWTDSASTFQFTVLNISGRDFLFGIAFFIGLLTLGILAIIREEGAVDREVVLDTLLSPMREISRPVSNMPGLTFLNNFPFGIIKRARFPGLDIALGVTVFQIAEMAKAATSAAVRGRRVTKRIAVELDKNIVGISRSRRKIRKHGVEVAKQMARGAMHVVDEKPVEVTQLTDRVMEGVTTVSSQSGIKPQDAVSGASQGIIQGAIETDADIAAAVAETIIAAKEAAPRLGISEELAVKKAAEGALQVADSLGPEVAAEVMEGIPGEDFPSSKRKSHEHTPPR